MSGIRLVISGSCGRMGRAIASLVLSDADHLFRIVAALEATGHDAVGHDYGIVLGRATNLGLPVVDDARSAIEAADVLIEFTRPDVTVAHARLAQELKRPMVIGTTGLSEEHLRVVQAAAKVVPVVLSPNMSLGVNVLLELAQTAARRLGLSFDVEVVEAHHRGKKDAPSGTALRLAEGVAAVRGTSREAVPVHAVRAGDIVGDHTVILAGPSERLELTHRAHNREVFARGALRAARFVHGKPAGLYDMAAVLAAS